MSDKRWLYAIRNRKDGVVRNMAVTDSIEASIGEVRAFLHSHPETAFAMYPADWELVYWPVPADVVYESIPFERWSVSDENR